jgi:hypothetical protein
MIAMGLELTEDDADYVLVAFDTTLDYAKMCKVCDYIRYGKPYIATHPDYNCPTETGFIPDMGAIMAFIEASTGRKADIILGKPYGGIVEEALERTLLHQVFDLGTTLHGEVSLHIAQRLTRCSEAGTPIFVREARCEHQQPDQERCSGYEHQRRGEVVRPTLAHHEIENNECYAHHDHSNRG